MRGISILLHQVNRIRHTTIPHTELQSSKIQYTDEMVLLLSTWCVVRILKCGERELSTGQTEVCVFDV